MTATAYSPAATSSTTIPIPSGSRSSCRTGYGFTISKARKSIKPAKKDFQERGAPRSVTSWPAVSSITTNCGSLIPEARATEVAAGMPRATVKTARKRLAGKIHAAGSKWETTAQRIRVASDPHVPGPGFKRPAPKKVATRVAQRGADRLVDKDSVVP